MRKKNIYGFTAILIAGLMMSGCASSANIDTNTTGGTNTESQQTSDYSAESGTAEELSESTEVTKISLENDTATVSGKGAEVSGNTVTITKKGTYSVSGTLTDGQIIVDTEDKVQLILENVTITNDDSACIYVKNADKVSIILADGSENTLSDTGAEYAADGDENIDGVIYSKDDISFSGSGSLTVNAGYKHGIVGNDDLDIKSGTYTINAAEKGIKANDSIKITDGSIDITAGDDGIHTSSTDEGKGYIYISGGEIKVASKDDGIHAERELVIDAGTIDVSESKEGLEGSTVTINDGNITLVASDDGINAVGTAESTGEKSKESFLGDQESSSGGQENSTGDQESASGDQESSSGKQGRQRPENFNGQMPENFNGQMPENFNGQMPENFNGQMPEDFNGQKPEDFNGQKPENFNGQMPENFNGQMPGNFNGQGGMMMDAVEDAVLTINGGVIKVNAGGDGLDSNGYIYINGGEVYVDGPTNDGNGAIDTGYDATISGGTVIAAGSSGMAVNFSSASEQYSILYNFSQTIEAGKEVQLLDSEGTVIASYTPEKAYSSVVISNSDIKEATYTIKAGDVEDTIEVTGISTTAGTKGGFGNRGER